MTKKLFDNFIMFVILISSISLASEDPVDEDSPRNYYLGIADYFFTAIFTFEVCLKVRNQGSIWFSEKNRMKIKSLKLDKITC